MWPTVTASGARAVAHSHESPRSPAHGSHIASSGLPAIAASTSTPGSRSRSAISAEDQARAVLKSADEELGAGPDGPERAAQPERSWLRNLHDRSLTRTGPDVGAGPSWCRGPVMIAPGRELGRHGYLPLDL
jgi:hypothetical protein